MGSRIEHRAEFAHGVAEVLAAVASADALRARLAQLGGKDAELRHHEWHGDTVRYTLLQGIAAERLPGTVRALHNGDLVVRREQTFEPAGAGYTGTTTAHVNGVPGEITADTELDASGGGATLRTTGEVTIRMPLVGAKLEGVVAEQVTKLLEREAEFTANWLAAGG